MGESFQRGSWQVPAASGHARSWSEMLISYTAWSPLPLHVLEVGIAAKAGMENVPAGDTERSVDRRVCQTTPYLP
jgi:hypothetical protein